MRFCVKWEWLHWRGTGQGFEPSHQVPEETPHKAVSEQILDQRSISGTARSQQGAMEADCSSAVTPVFINNGE
jgi:hypothetical protein